MEVRPEFQLTNCENCYFAIGEKVGTGEPCCTYPSKLDHRTIEGSLICFSRREDEPRT